MKKLILICTLFISVSASAQILQKINSYGYEWKKGQFDSTLKAPQDTTVHGPLSDSLAFAYKNRVRYIYDGAKYLPDTAGLKQWFTPSATTITLSGDVSGSGTSTIPTTLATVNSNVFGTNTFLKFGVNGKGLVTSAAAVASADITGALGYTPYNAANPSNYISSVTLSGDVTGTGPGTVTTTLANSGVTPSSTTLTNITVNSKGIITAATQGNQPWGTPININTNSNGVIASGAEADYVYVKGVGGPDSLYHFYNKVNARDTLWVRYSLDGGGTWSTPVKADLHLWFPQVEYYAPNNMYYATGTTSAEKNVWLYQSSNKINWTALNAGNPVLSASTDTTNYAYSLFNTGFAIIRNNGVDTIHYLCEGSAKQAQAGVTAGGGWYANGPYSGYTKAPLSSPAATLPLKPQLTGGNTKLFVIPEHNSFLCMYGIYSGQFPDYSQPWYIQFAKASLANNLQDSTSWIPIQRQWRNLGNSADPTIAFLGNQDSAIVYYEYNQGASGNQAYMPHMRSPLQLFRALNDTASSTFQNARVKGYLYHGNTSLTEWTQGDNTGGLYMAANAFLYFVINGTQKGVWNSNGLTVGNNTQAPAGASLFVNTGSVVIGTGTTSLGGGLQINDPTVNTSTNQNLLTALAPNASYPVMNFGTSATRYGSLLWADPGGAGMFFQTYQNTFPISFQGSYNAFGPGGTERARVTSGGALLIGLTAPVGTEKLNVNGTGIGVTEATADSSNKYATTAWVKRQAYGTGTGGSQTLTYTQNATNNTLAISGGNTATFLTATSTLAGLIDTMRLKWMDSVRLGQNTTNIINAKIGDTAFRTTGPGLAARTIQFKSHIANNGVSEIVTDSTITHQLGGTLIQNTTINNNGFNLNLSGTGTTTIAGPTTLNGTGTVNANIVMNNTVYGNGLGSSLQINSQTMNNGVTAANGVVTDFSNVSLGSNALTATNTNVQYTRASTLYINGPPTASTNTSITSPYSLYIASGNTRVLGDVQSQHYTSISAVASVVANAGAGTGSSITTTTSSAGDAAGFITLSTGTAPTANSTQVTVTFGRAYAAAPAVVLFPANATAAALTGTQGVYVSTTTTGFTINSNTTAISASTSYSWYYHVIQPYSGSLP